MLHANHVIFGIILSMWNPTWDAQFKIQGFAQSKEMEVLNKWGIERCNTYFMSNFIRKYVYNSKSHNYIVLKSEVLVHITDVGNTTLIVSMLSM